MYKHILFFCLFLRCLQSMAQYNSMGYYRQAEKLFAAGDFNAAAQYYEKYLTVDKRSRPAGQPFAVQKKGHISVNPRLLASCHLAIAYMQQHDYEKAQRSWVGAAKFDRSAFPEYNYWYGCTLIAVGKYEEAFAALTTFEKEYTAMGPILIDADRQLANLRFIQAGQKRGNPNAFIITRQSDKKNTTSYAMSIRRDDTLVFTAVSANSPYFNELYELPPAPRSDTDLLSAATLFPAPLDSISRGGETHNGLATFSRDGNTLFFTRWTKTKGITHSAIWSRHLSDSGWSQPALQGAPLNIGTYNSTQPFLTDDGKYLLFASDRPGGTGGYDIWYADLDSGYQAIAAANLGTMINTPGDEQSPYYHHKAHTLVFASNGRIGMGGFDLYYAKGYFNLFKWENPVNPGMPLNSSKDDLYFLSTDEDNIWNTGWISSDRGQGCCLALYSVRQDNRQYISGTIVDCQSQQPLKDVRLTVTDGKHAGRTLTSTSTDSLGGYRFLLSNTSRFRISATKDGYDPLQGAYAVQMETGSDTIVNDLLCMNMPVPTPASTRLPALLGNWPYKTSALPAEVHHSLDSLAILMHDSAAITIQIEGYTDGVGGVAYNIRLARARVDACIRYLVRKGVDPARLRGKSFGKCCPLVPETIDGRDNPAAREKNRRVEYRVVY